MTQKRARPAPDSDSAGRRPITLLECDGFKGPAKEMAKHLGVKVGRVYQQTWAARKKGASWFEVAGRRVNIPSEAGARSAWHERRFGTG